MFNIHRMPPRHPTSMVSNTFTRVVFASSSREDS